MTFGVDVVSVAFGAGPDLEAAIRSVLGSAVVRSVTVVDHGSPDAGSVAARTGATCVRDATNPGFGAGQNRGAALGSAELILVLNPDCVMHPGALEDGVDFLESHPDVAMVQGAIANDATGEVERSQGVELGPIHLWARALGLRRLIGIGIVRRAANRSRTLRDHVERTPEGPTRVQQLAATAVLLRRSAFDAVGGFDDGYFLYGEDLDICRRLRTAGWSLVSLPRPWGRHVGGQSSAGWARRELVWWEGTMRFAARWWGSSAFVAGMAAAVLRCASLILLTRREVASSTRRMVVSPLRTRFGESAQQTRSSPGPTR